MNNKLLEIINTFGITAQQRKLQEEMFELQEAITTHELKKSVEYEIPLTEIVGTKEHIIEEVADVYTILGQLLEYYDIDAEELIEKIDFKVNRTLDRIKNNYYK